MSRQKKRGGGIFEVNLQQIKRRNNFSIRIAAIIEIGCGVLCWRNLILWKAGMCRCAGSLFLFLGDLPGEAIDFTLRDNLL